MTETLKKHLEAGDLAACVAWLEAATSEGRRAASVIAQKRVAECVAEWRKATQGKRNQELFAAYEIAIVLAIATSTPAEWKKCVVFNVPLSVVDTLARLRPAWLDEAAEHFVALGGRHIWIARALVRKGLSKRPTSEDYLLGLVVDPRFGPHPFDEDPALLDHEAWQLFEIEGGGEVSLAARDKYTHDPEKTWASAYLRHMRARHLDRARLIDATLGALERDFAPFRAGWFSRFHESLEVTLEERAARTSRYVRLLASAVPATVTLAFEAVRSVDASRPLPADSLVPSLQSLVLARQKGTALAAVKLLRVIATREPTAALSVARALSIALAHETPDVQKAALDSLEPLAKAHAEITPWIAERAPDVAATLKKRVAALLGAPASPRGSALPKKVQSARFGRKKLGSPLDPSCAVVPLATFDDLLESFSAVLEDGGDPNEVERVLDGVSRLGAHRPPDFDARVRPLHKRAQSLAGRFLGPLQESLVLLALAWTAPAGQGSALLSAPKTTERLLLKRWQEELLARRITALVASMDKLASAPLLSAPTHRGGWIAPGVLVDRARSRGRDEAPLADACLSLLRLSPEGREDALRRLRKSGAPKSEFTEALAHALGGAAKVGKTSPLWAAAARSRAPRETDDAVKARHPRLGPDGAVAASFAWTIESRHRLAVTVKPPVPDPASIPVELIAVRRHNYNHAESDHSFSREGEPSNSYERWLATLWPAGTESYCASWLERAGWAKQFATCFEYLGSPWVEFGPLATLLVVVGLAAKDPGASGLATDAMIAALSDRRITGVEIGQAMASLREPHRYIHVKRWALPLQIVANVSDAHAAEIAVALQAFLRGSPKDAPLGEGALVSLLMELLARIDGRIEDAEAWRYLQGSKHAKVVSSLASPELVRSRKPVRLPKGR